MDGKIVVVVQAWIALPGNIPERVGDWFETRRSFDATGEIKEITPNQNSLRNIRRRQKNGEFLF